MKFVDEVTISVKAGDGGPGSSHFRREAYVPRGGPDGGDGGDGGSVIVRADEGKRTLLDFKLKPGWKAENGVPGAGSRKSGAKGKDLQLALPVGTQIFQNSREGELVVDLNHHGQEFVLAAGGKGGRGNSNFATSTNRAPEYAQPGLPGEEGEFLLTLKLLADVGLVGLPNAGKSSFLKRVTKATPKVADYPFTTLEPQLGVAKGPGNVSFVIADIPGLIEGAHSGKGLGIQFLKHLERCKVFVHLLSAEPLMTHGREGQPELLHQFELVRSELGSFNPELLERPFLICLNKVDLVSDKDLLEATRVLLSETGSAQSVLLSTASGEGIERVLSACAERAF
ncbi:MAG: GTPase ObgE [Bdellovibrionales bacterium]|nr:GTPase ObgE [Bdellovibrionales bacterium]